MTSKFDPSYVEEAYQHCKDGAIDRDLASIFGIHVATIYEWKKAHPEFADALKRGKCKADYNIVKALNKKATGFSEEGQYFAPDTGAIALWLKNRRPENWKDKPTVKISLPDGLKPHEKLEHYNDALANGLISIEMHTALVNGVHSAMKVKEVTELEDRIKQLEGVAGVNDE